MEQEIAALERRSARLDAVETYLRSDEYVEYAARRFLGFKRLGESMAIVTNPSGENPTISPRSTGGPWWESLFSQ